MADYQRDSGKPEAVRRHDGGGETSPLPSSEAARGNEQAEAEGADEGAATETWTPSTGETGVRPGSPAEAAVAGTAPADAPQQPDTDPQAGQARMPQPGAGQAAPTSGADAPSHGSR